MNNLKLQSLKGIHKSTKIKYRLKPNTKASSNLSKDIFIKFRNHLKFNKKHIAVSIKVYYISEYINDQAIYECIDFFYFQPVFPIKLRRKSIHKLFRTIDKRYKTGNLFPSDTILFPLEEL